MNRKFSHYSHYTAFECFPSKILHYQELNRKSISENRLDLLQTERWIYVKTCSSLLYIMNYSWTSLKILECKKFQLKYLLVDFKTILIISLILRNLIHYEKQHVWGNPTSISVYKKWHWQCSFWFLAILQSHLFLENNVMVSSNK